tara:strand:- start:2170 stop:2646 length:477 start_codon:yes stop_codon:yes gene_type:complete
MTKKLSAIEALPDKLRSMRAHTYASENADEYRAYDAGLAKAADMIEAALTTASQPVHDAICFGNKCQCGIADSDAGATLEHKPGCYSYRTGRYMDTRCNCKPEAQEPGASEAVCENPRPVSDTAIRSQVYGHCDTVETLHSGFHKLMFQPAEGSSDDA